MSKLKMYMSFTQSITPFTEEGRGQITQNLRKDIRQEISIVIGI